MLNNHCVYIHTFPNNKQYVGQAVGNVKKRWGKDGNGYKSQRLLREALNEFSWDMVKHEIVADNLSQEEADIIEKEYIRKLNTLTPNGYNTRIGGKDGVNSTTNIIVQKNGETIVNIFFNIEDAQSKLNMSINTIKQYCRTSEKIGSYSLERFVDFPVSSFYNMAFPNNEEHYNIQKYIWKKEEDDFLMKHYQEKGSRWCASKLGRTESAIQRRASVIGITKNFVRYTEKEKEFIRLNYEKHGAQYCAEHLGRNKNSIITKAHELHLKENKYYTQEDEDYILNNYQHCSNKELAEKLNRSTSSIQSKLNNMGLSRKFDYSDCDKWLVNNYSKIGASECAKILNLSKTQIYHRVQKLGIHMQNDKSYGRSKYKYVIWDKRNNKWKVVMSVNGQKKQFGSFDNEEDAYIVAIEKAKEYKKY